MNICKTKLDIKGIDEEGILTGYASVFGNADLHNDIIMRGAFRGSIDRCNKDKGLPKLLWQHDHTMPIGNWLDIYEDAYGLFVKGKLFLNTQKGREAYELVKGGVVDGLSIGFKIEKSKKVNQYRLIQKIDLQEISLVTFAANPKAKVMNCKSFLDEYSRCLERFLERIEKLRGCFFNQSACLDT